jgi:YegS C-terminal NAD kinase beta sandwich-like domain
VTIERGKDWGEPAAVPADIEWAASDRAATEIITRARRANLPIPAIALTAGDLSRTLGGRGQRLRDGEGTRVHIDLGAVLIDGRLHWFLAHLVARHSWYRGRIVVAANGAFLGSWNIAPRAHPGDGRIDLLDGNPGLGDRLKARRRLPLGTHLPHPAITVRRVSAAQIEFARPTPIRLDGVRTGTARSLSIRVEPDAVEIWI